jgi:REP element-mobilizing transposase RayT
MPRFYSKQLRKGRFSETGRIYLITTNCDLRRRVFLSATAARIVIDEFEHQEKLENCDSLAFVVMPDHVHWMLQLKAKVELSMVIRQMKGRAAFRINQTFSSNGRLWQPGFHDHGVRREEDLENLANYIIRNPIRGKLVNDIEHYPHWGSVWHERRPVRG